MKVGFTGTQVGMSSLQKKALAEKLIQVGATEFHHGDCVGADAEAHDIALGLGLQIVIHPPSDSKKRAFCLGAAEIRPEKPYIARNHDIVDETNLLFVGPQGSEVLRSGTWATKRYAERNKKKFVILERG